MSEANINNPSTNKFNGIMPICVDTEGLQVLLSCGYKTATEIGLNADAKLMIGKRVLWSTEKIKDYVKDKSIGI